jgi:ribose 1,5-bisphosphokinase
MGGRLIYLMGPSGSGKDSLLNAARERLAVARPLSGVGKAGKSVFNSASAMPVVAHQPARGWRIAQRVITRSAEAAGEDAIAVSLADFERQEADNAFAMSWRANGLAYGIPRQIDEWLAAGLDVLVNGSRAYLNQARQRYPGLIGVVLTVDIDVLRERLLARGRRCSSWAAIASYRSTQSSVRSDMCGSR